MSVPGRSAADEVLAAGLAAGKTVAQAAADAHMSERTGYRRLGEPGFRARVQELRSGMIAQAAGRLAFGMTGAANTLLLLLQSNNENVRHKSARSVIELGLKITELAELERRVAELEKRDHDRGELKPHRNGYR